MKITIHFTDVDPNNTLSKASFTYNRRGSFSKFLKKVESAHNTSMAALSAQTADQLTIYTPEGNKLNRSNFAAIIITDEDVRLTVIPRRHMQPAAGIYGSMFFRRHVQPVSVTSLLGSNEQPQNGSHSLEQYHRLGSDARLVLTNWSG